MPTLDIKLQTPDLATYKIVLRLVA